MLEYNEFNLNRMLESLVNEYMFYYTNAFADILKKVSGTFDTLFDKRFPYMMCIHQAPVNSPEYGDYDSYYHFHVEFYPPLRSKDKIKYYASSEMGAWAACNPTSVEDTAIELRNAYERYLKENK